MVKSENNKIKKEPSKALKSISSTSASDSKKKYKGVRMRTWGSWVSEIRAPNQKTRIWLGSYSNPEAAARAYDAALLCLKGSSATNLNFPLASSSQYYHIPPQDTIMSPKSIQRVAAAAANSFINDNIATSTPPSPPPPSASSSMASSLSDQIDDDLSLVSSFEAYNYDDQAMAMNVMEPWFGLEGLQSPKYVDQMLSGATASFFDIDSSHLLNNDLYLYEESDDIRLWNFS